MSLFLGKDFFPRVVIKMSTKSSLTYAHFKDNGHHDKHRLCCHVYEDLHCPSDTVVVELYCSTCYESHKFMMSKHLGVQLSDLLSPLEVEMNGYDKSVVKDRS